MNTVLGTLQRDNITLERNYSEWEKWFQWFWLGLIRSSLWANPSSFSYFQHLTFHTDSKGWLKLQMKIQCHVVTLWSIYQAKEVLFRLMYVCFSAVTDMEGINEVRSSLLLDLNRSASLVSIQVISECMRSDNIMEEINSFLGRRGWTFRKVEHFLWGPPAPCCAVFYLFA